MRKGQAAVEFVILTSFMFLVFALSIVYVNKSMADFSAAGKQASIVAVEDAIEKELALAYTMPDGYVRRFELPDTVQGLGYQVTVVDAEDQPNKDAVIVQSGTFWSIAYLDQRVQGTLHPGINSLRKTGGVLYLNT